MTHYKKPDEKASQTVTFRLTVRERELLSELANIENKSLTDLLRALLHAHAEKISARHFGKEQKDLGSTPMEVQRMVGSDHLEIGEENTRETEKLRPQIVENPANSERKNESQHKTTTFGELVEQFRVSFAGRADGTRNELEETIRFLCHPSRGEPLITPETLLSELTSARLERLRNSMKTAEMRMAKKNLHLTYLRMMLHWAVKQENMDIKANPAMELKPFTMNEDPGSWPGRGFIP